MAGQQTRKLMSDTRGSTQPICTAPHKPTWSIISWKALSTTYTMARSSVRLPSP